MASLCKVMLIGHLGRDPESRYLPNGDVVCNFSIATSESWTDKQSGQKVVRTEWHNIVMYRRLAEIAAQYLKKGSQVYVEGKIQSEKYTGKDGIERTAYKIVANEMKMLGGKPAPPADYAPPPSAGYTSAQYAAAKNGTPPSADDDIPF